MNPNCFIKPAILTMSLLGATWIHALKAASQSVPMNITTVGVPFLSISPDARSAGMGDLGIVTGPDAWSGMHNMAKTPFALDRDAIGVTYAPWLRDIVQDMYLLSASGYHRLGDNEAFSAGLRYFNLGDVPVSDYSGNKLQTSHPREYSFEGGYSRKLSSSLGLGLTVRYIHSDLGAGDLGGTRYKAANAVSADISLYYNGLGKEGKGWTGGLAVCNLGSKVSYTDDAAARDFLPANLGFGLGYTGVENEDNKWTLSVEANKLLVPSTPSDPAKLADYHAMPVTKSWSKSFSNSAYRFSVGGEYGYKQFFFLRLGYQAQTQQAGDLKYFTTGVGLKYSSIGVDLSYLIPSGAGVSRNPLSNTLRLGISFNIKQ